MATTTACDCALEGDHPRESEPCHAVSPNGNHCSKPNGHDGAHAACNVIEHPTETWEDDNGSQ